MYPLGAHAASLTSPRDMLMPRAPTRQSHQVGFAEPVHDGRRRALLCEVGRERFDVLAVDSCSVGRHAVLGGEVDELAQRLAVHSSGIR